MYIVQKDHQVKVCKLNTLDWFWLKKKSTTKKNHCRYFFLWRNLSTKALMLLNCGAGEDSWESLGLQEMKPVNPKGNQSWVFIRRNDAESETPIIWPPDVKHWLTGKDPDAGKDWRLEEKGTPEDKMDGWHHQLNGHEFEQTPGDSGGQRSLGYCSPWGNKELDMT